jgi:hypothetical protein
MKRKPPIPEIEGATAWQRLDRAFRMVLTVPKDSLLKAEAKEKEGKRTRAKKRA